MTNLLFFSKTLKFGETGSGKWQHSRQEDSIHHVHGRNRRRVELLQQRIFYFRFLIFEKFEPHVFSMFHLHWMRWIRAKIELTYESNLRHRPIKIHLFQTLKFISCGGIGSSYWGGDRETINVFSLVASSKSCQYRSFIWC